MYTLTLEIGDIPYDILVQFAEGNNMTPDQYATNILVNWLNSHIRDFYKSKIDEESFDSLEQKFGKVKIKKGP